MKLDLIINLIAAGQGFLLGMVLFFSIRQGKKANLFLGGMILVFAMLLLDIYLRRSGYNENWPRIPVDSLYSIYFLAPLFYFYVKSNIEEGFQWKSIYWLPLLPGILEMAFHLSDYIYLYFNGTWFFSRATNSIVNKITEFIPLICLGGVLLWAWIKTKNWNNKSTSKKNWLAQMILWGLIICSLNLFIVIYDNFIGSSDYSSLSFSDQAFRFMLLVVSAWIFAIAYRGYTKPELFHDPYLESKENMGNKIQDTAFPAYDDQKALLRLQEQLEGQKIYRQAKLTLKELAGNLNLPQKYVSYLINHYHQKNFHDYVNTFRLQEVIQHMQNPNFANYTLLALALESGFNSKSTFNLYFKKHTGLTPSAFKKQKQMVNLE